MDWLGFAANVGAGTVTTWAISAAKKTPVGMGVSIVGGAVGGVVGQWAEDGSFTLEGTVKGIATGIVGGVLGFGAGKLASKAINKWSPGAQRGANSTLVGLVSALVREGWNKFNNSGDDGGGGGGGQGGSGGGGGSAPLMWSGLAAADSAGLMGKPPFVPTPGIVATGSGFLPHPVELDPIIAIWYGGVSNSFASSLVENYQMFGDLEEKEDLAVTPIRALVVPAALPSGSDSGLGYAQAVQALNDSAKVLNQTQADLAGALEEAEEITRAGQENIAELIRRVSMAMSSFPAGNIDAEFLSLLNQALGASMQIMEQAAASAVRAAGAIGAPGANSMPSGAALGSAVGQLGGGLTSPGLWPDSPTLPPPIADLDRLTPDEIGADSRMSPEFANSFDRSQQAGMSPNSAGFSPNAAGMAGIDPSGGMMNSMMTTMLPLLASQSAMRRSADRDLTGHRADIDSSRYERERAMTAPPMAPPVHTTPWSAQNSAAATPAAAPQNQAHSHTGPGTGATSSQNGGTSPQTPGADGSIVYTFPDGRTQKVSPTVARVLDKAFANIKGTDAQEAYADTEAKWKDPKEIGTRVDPFELMTGDVATWDDRVAVLVVFGAGEEGTLEAVVNGELEPFAPEMSDSAGEFGQFTGFMHPPGIELVGAKDKYGDVAGPAGDQQPASSAADAQIVVASA